MTPELFRFLESHKQPLIDGGQDERGRPFVKRADDCACGEPVTDFIAHWMDQAYRLGWQDRHAERDFQPRVPLPWYEID